MSYSPAFTVAQSADSPEDVTFEDTSTGSDAAIASRRIYITGRAGTYIVPSGVSTDYNAWALGSNPITISDLITQDLAVTVLVDWLNSAGTVLYSSTEKFCLREFNKQFFISLIQYQASNPEIVRDVNYFSNLAKYWALIEGAETMITDAADIAGSQACLDRVTNMMNRESVYFK